LILALIPGEALLIPWFVTARDLGVLDTTWVLALPVLVDAFSLIVFKLFFDGVHEQFNAARSAGQSASDAFISAVFVPSLPIVILVGSILSFASAQALLWPLIALRSRELFTYPVSLTVLRSEFASDFTAIVGGSMVFIAGMALVFLPIFALLQVFVVDRLALVAGHNAGWQDTPPAAETVDYQNH
jgi:ABC-type glycerol-3-phosphate transport system permease component